jgi:protein-disulfide isomerase
VVITKNGVQKDGKKYDSQNTNNVVRDYQDFLCPGCGSVNRMLGTPFRTYLKNGDMILKDYPISILDNISQGDKYSTRVAAMAYRIAELDPEHYLDFVDFMFSEKIQPDEQDFKNISDEKLESYAIKLGLSKENAKKAVDGKYTDYVTSNTKKITADTSLWRTGASGTKQFMTPIVIVNNKSLDFDQPDTLGPQLAKAIGVDKTVSDGDGFSSK